MQTIAQLRESLDPKRIGAEMHELATRLYPFHRSITGDGVRQTLKIFQEYIPVDVHEVPTGTRVFDWTVPKEWNVRDAYIKDPSGRKVVDFKQCNLHVLAGSVPVRKRLPLSELKEHLYTQPEQPDFVPYRTAFYNETWGFCLAHNEMLALEDGEYEVVIDSTLHDGHLTYGECFLKGDLDDEVLISAHVCHPSLGNDNLSGLMVAVFLARHLSHLRRRYSYRFVFAPATIGAITWLARNEDTAHRIKHGLVATCLGDSGKFTYKRSRQGDAEIDAVALHVLECFGDEHAVVDFSPYGYDERQYCSPGFNLPVGSLTRSSHGQYPEYHTSADNLELMRPENLGDSLLRYASIVSVLERNRRYLNLRPKGEPRLGPTGLYRRIGHGNDADRQRELALLWVLNLSDGDHTLLEIAERSEMPFDTVYTAAEALAGTPLLREICSSSGAANG